MTQTIDRVRTKIEGPGQVFEFDSDAARPRKARSRPS